MFTFLNLEKETCWHLDGVNDFQIMCIFSIPMKNLGEISEMTANFLQMRELFVYLFEFGKGVPCLQFDGRNVFQITCTFSEPMKN